MLDYKHPRLGFLSWSTLLRYTTILDGIVIFNMLSFVFIFVFRMNGLIMSLVFTCQPTEHAKHFGKPVLNITLFIGQFLLCLRARCAWLRSARASENSRARDDLRGFFSCLLHACVVHLCNAHDSPANKSILGASFSKTALWNHSAIFTWVLDLI